MKNAFAARSLAVVAGLVLAWSAAGPVSAGVTFVVAHTDATTTSHTDVNGGMDDVPGPNQIPNYDPEIYMTLPNGTTNPAHSNALSVTDPYGPNDSLLGKGTNSELATPLFSSASTGTFTFVGSSSGYIAPGVTGSAGGAGFESGDYEFTVDTKSNLEVSYFAANTTAENGKDYYVALTGTSTFFFDNSKGVIWDVLAPGTYTLGFGQDIGADEVSLNEPGTIASTSNATFGFNITAVPEPATWASMLCGLFGAGAMLRRLRRGNRPPLGELC